ncbi:MAG: hypothetical protein ACR2QU_08050 [Gammaproteobacteria bacterium]
MNASHLTLAVDNSRAPVSLVGERILLGHNVYHSSTIVRQRVALGSLTGLRTCDLGPEFVARYLERFGTLENLRPEGHSSPGFLARLEHADGVPVEEALFEGILSVDSAMAFLMRNLELPAYRRILPSPKSGMVDLIWATEMQDISLAAAIAGHQGFVELLSGGLQPKGSGNPLFDKQLKKLRKIAMRRQRSMNAEAVALSARQRGLPYNFIGGSYLRLGQGIEQHIIHASHVPARSVWRDSMDREKTLEPLPVTRRHTVTSADAARIAGQELGYPLALKPLRGRQARGTTVWVNSSSEIESAFSVARRDGESVTVEERVEGELYRILVVDGRFVAASKIDPPDIVGDGQRTIRQLIQSVNNEKLRKGVWQSPIAINQILVDHLSSFGYALEEVLAEHAVIRILCADSHTTGATCSDVTDRVHTENQELAVRAAEDAKLTIAVVDFVTSDIRRSYREIGGSIVEVSKNIDLAMYVWPTRGKRRNVGESILQLVFPPGRDGRIPIVMVVGSRGRAHVAASTESLLRASGLSVGLAQPKISKLAGRPARLDTSSRQHAVQFLLQDPRAELVIGAITPKRIIRKGLGLDRCNVAAILNPKADEDSVSYRRGLTVLIQATTGQIIVDAKNSIAIAELSRVPPSRVVILSLNAKDRTVRRHLAAGGCAIIRDKARNQDRIVLNRGSEKLLAVPVPSLFGSTLSAASSSRLRERMYALAVGYGAGLSIPQLKEAAIAWPSFDRSS